MKSVFVKSCRKSSLIALVTAAVAGFGAMNAAKAVTYTYTPTNATTDVWSAGTNWDATPVSATDTTLVFVGDNTTVLADGLTNINTDDVADQFSLNILNLQGTGPASGAATITIASSSPATGLTLGGTTPTVNLNALAGTAGLTYDVSTPVTLGANTTFTGAGTANFNFSGGIAGGTNTLTKTGTSVLTLGGTNTLGALSVGFGATGGTVKVASGGTLSVGTGTEVIRVGAAITGVSGTFSGTLDVSQATSFTANVATFGVAYNSSNSNNAASSSSGTLLLGTNNDITATSSFRVGSNDLANNNPMGTGGIVTTAASGVTTIKTPIMNIGTGKSAGSFTLGSGSTLNVSGVTLGSRTQLNVGNETLATSSSFVVSLDASNGVFNGTLSRLLVGNNQIAGSTTATMTLSTDALNHLDISGASSTVFDGTTLGVVTVGRNNQTSGLGTGTLTIGNLDATSSITSTTPGGIGILVGYGTQAGAVNRANGTVNLNGGTLTITTTGSAITGSLPGNNTAGSSTVNFNGITLKAGATSTNWISNLTTANLGTGGLKVDTNSFDLTTAQTFSGTGNLTKQGAGTLTLTGSNTYTGGVSVQGGALVAGTASALGNGATATTISLTGGMLDLNGASVLALNIGASDFSLNGGALSLTLESGVSFDTLASTGTFSLTSGTIALSGTVADGTYQILNFTSGTVGSLSFTGLGVDQVANFDNAGLLTISTIPEPATTILAIAGLVALLVTTRMRSKRNA